MLGWVVFPCCDDAAAGGVRWCRGMRGAGICHQVFRVVKPEPGTDNPEEISGTAGAS